MENKLVATRINVLDGFRAIAILMVLFFLYFSRWTSLYPYGNKYDFFTFGKMGVHFFFIISGFVIFYTLENTKHFLIFWIKRMIRLFPSMLVATLITYFFCNSFDLDFLFPTSHFFKNVLASVTFLPPDTLASLFNNRVQLDYISGNYWSLWPEIQFYLFVSAIYFFNKNKFLSIFISLSITLVLSNLLIHSGYFENNFIKVARKFFIVFNLVGSLPYFSFGVLFYSIFKDKTLNQKTPIYLKVYFAGMLLLQIHSIYSEPIKIGLIFIFLMLFIALIYYPKQIRFLENKILLKVGISSYFLYLIHENIGNLIIHKYAGYLYPYEFIFTFILMILLIVLSIFYSYGIEKKLNKYLKHIFFNNSYYNQLPEAKIYWQPEK